MNRKKNSYILATETVKGVTKYYVSFVDGQGEKQVVEVSHLIFDEFLKFVKKERNLKRWVERHIEQSDLRDETLLERAFNPPKSVEETVLDEFVNEQIHQAIETLSKTQRQRFILYFEFDFTYQQIADMEGCSFQVVARSIKAAEKNILKYFQMHG